MNLLRLPLAASARALRERGLAVALWLPHLLLALVVVDPVATRLGARLDADPGAAASFLGAVPLDDLVELLRAESSFAAALGPLVAVVVLVALLLNPWLAGGALEVLLTDDRRPLLHRFGRGAGRFAGRNLRAGLAALLLQVVLLLLVLVPASGIASRLADADREVAATWFRLGGLALAALALLVVSLGLDFARVRMARTDRRDALRSLARGLLTVLRRPLPTLGAWAILGVVTVGIVAALDAVGGLLAPRSLVAIAVVAALDQIGRLARAGYRVALWSAEIEIDGG